MISLDGYEITSQLYEGEKTIIYRGKRGIKAGGKKAYVYLKKGDKISVV